MPKNIRFSYGPVNIRNNHSMLLAELIEENSTRQFINFTEIAFKLVLERVYALTKI